MTTLTPAQVASYALAAGFQGHGATKAVAVALAESGGRTDATGTNSDKYRSRDRGLWQINSHWHPEVTDAQAYDPAQAAAAAYRISHAGRDWSAWSTWTNGKAAAMTGRAKLAVAQAKKGGGVTGSSTTATPAFDPFAPNPINPFGLNPLDPFAPFDNGSLGGMLGAAGDATKAVGAIAVLMAHASAWTSDPHNWLRILFVAGGAVAVVTAGVLLAESGAAGSTARTVARTTSKAGKAAGKAAAIL